MERFISCALALFLLFHCLTPCSSSFPVEIVSSTSIPPPWDDPKNVCHPRTSLSDYSLVCDPSGLLTLKQVTDLNNLLNQVFQGVKPYSLIDCQSTASDSQTGFRFVVVLVRRMEQDALSLPDRAQKFTNDIFSKWNLNANCGASVLMFLSYQDKRMYVQTGVTANNYLNPDRIGDVYSEMIPLLRKQRLADAVLTGASSIAKFLSKYKGKHRTAPAQSDEPQPNGITAPLFFKKGPEWWDLELSVIAILFAVFVVFACCNGIGGTDATRLKRERKIVRRSLDMIKSEYVAASLPQYIPATCPICGEDLTPAWVPAVPPGASEDPDIPQVSSSSTRPVRTLRCRHAFLESCFDEEFPTPSGTIPHCPICDDRGGGITTPPPISQTRDQDAAFRLRYLAKRFPHILSRDVTTALTVHTPAAWPDHMTDAYLNRIKSECEQTDSGERATESGNDAFGWIGGIVAATGIGALLGSMFSGWGDDERSDYSTIPSGYGTQWGGATGAGGGDGLGATWSNSTGNQGSGLGAGWGDNTGSGSGWGGGGGDGGGDGAGTGW